MRCAEYRPSRRHVHAGGDCLTRRASRGANRSRGRNGEAKRLSFLARRRLEAEAIADGHGRRDVDQQIGAVTPRHDADCDAVIVRVRTRDVATTGATDVHAGREPAAEDLNERLHFLERRWRDLALLEAVQEGAIALCDRRDILGFLLSAFDLETADPCFGQ
jgi:hypothetical protein